MRAPFSVLLLSLLLLFSPSSSASSTEAKTRRILRCLGHHAADRADHAKVQALLHTNPDPHNENAWLSLSPNTWGFKSHTSPGSDTWTPQQGWAQTAKDRIARQHRKLLRCANEAMQDPAAQPQPAGDSGVAVGPFGSKDVSGLAMNDAQDIKPGQDIQGKDQQKSSDGTGAAPVAAGAQIPPGGQGTAPAIPNQKAAQGTSPATTPPSGQKTDPPVPGQDPAPGTPPTTTPTTPGKKTDMAATDNKLAPGLGPDVHSVAPDLENDPTGKFLPKSAAASAAAGQSGTSTGASALQVGDSSQNGIKDALDRQNKDFPTASNGQRPNSVQTKLAVAADGSKQLNGADTTSPGCKEIRIRKEYSTLTREEKKALADAIKGVRQKPSRFKPDDPQWNRADDWTLLHIRMVKYVHFTAYFALFHRAFIALVEQDLIESGLPIGIPWVDWSKTADDPSKNPIFDADPEYGLGTNGQGDNTDCPWATGLAVTDGALSDHFFNAPFRHRLCRQFNNMDVKAPNPHFGVNCTTFINSDFIRGLGAAHNKGKFFDFSSALEISTHLSMHTCIGGNLAWLTSSPNDFVFHCHHGLVDNILDAWQKKHPQNKKAFHGPKQQENYGKHPPWTATKDDIINFSPLAENVKVEDLLDPESGAWGGRMCYRYDYNVAV